MAADAITIRVTLSEDDLARSAASAAQKVTDAFQRVRDQVKGFFGGNEVTESAEKIKRAVRDVESDTLRLAQARARLQIATGDMARAEGTLKDALANTSRESTASLNAQRQLVGIQSQLKTAAGQAESAMLREAQAVARLKQISGDTPGAIKALEDALKKVSNPSSLAAVRAEIQKTYLTTNYANSPLIGAIRSTNQGLNNIIPVAGKVGSALSSVFSGFLGGLVGGGILGTFESLARTALSASIEIDKNRQTLVALTGSAALANQKLAELRDLAQKAPGLTATLAVSGYAQLKAAGDVADQTINQLLQGFGKLNSVFSIEDPKKFFGNLVQIFTQNFSERDIKEAVRAIPIFRTILNEAFGTSDPGALRKLKASGKLTLDTFLSGLSTGIENNPVLKNVQESVGTQLEKVKDRITFALAPIGDGLSKGLLNFASGLAGQLEASQVEIGKTIVSIQELGGVIANLGGDTGDFFSLSKNLQDVREFIDFVTGGVVFLEDLVQLAAAFVTKVIKGMVLAIESAVDGFFSLFGIKIDSLREDMLRLGTDIAVIDERLGQGFKNTDEFFRRKRERDLVVDVGNAVATDPNNPGKPLVSQVKPGGSGADTESHGKKRISLLQQEQREVAKLQQQVDALETGKGFGKLFDLELKKNDLQETKSQLNEIIKLRRLVGEDVKAPLPIGKDAREAVLRDLNREKQTREAILKLADAQVDAEAKLRIAVAATTAPVVSADTRAKITIAEAETARRNANEQSLADTIAAQDKIDKLDAKHLEFLSEAILAEQTRSIVAIKSAKEQIIAEQARQRVIGDGELLRQQFAEDAKAARLKESNDAKVTILKNEAFLTAGLISLEEDLALARSNQATQRLKEERDAAVKIKLAEDEIAKLRAGDTAATGRVFQNDELAKDQERLRVLQQLVVLRKEASTGFSGAEFISDVQAKAEADRLSAFKSGAEEIIKLQDQIAHSGEDSAQRQQKAYLEAVHSIQEADLAARDQIIRSQVEIADKSIFHSDRSNAAVLQHLNEQTKGITEIVSGAKIQLIDSVFSAADRGIEKLTAHLGLFKGFISEILSGLARMVISKAFQAIFGLSGGGGGGFGGGGGQQASAGGGIGSFLSSFLGIRQAASQGSSSPLASAASAFAGGLPGPASFLTPGFNPAANTPTSGINVGSLIQQALRGGSPASALATPASVSLPVLGNIGPGNLNLLRGPGQSVVNSASSLASLSGLFKGFGFGQKSGSGGALAGLAPFLGASLGSSLGTDTLTKIIGGVGGAALGIGLTAAPALLAGSPALAALFSNPITAIVGGALLVGAFFLGRARQRKRDEATSGDALQQAVDQIKDLRKQIESDQTTLSVAQAHQLLESDIIGPFVQSINQLKTKSVRESRLAHQVPDLRNLFEKEVIPAITAQKARQKTGQALVPEFALGGIVPGIPTGRDSVLSWLSPQEMVLTVRQQRSIAALAGGDVFAQAGVPGAGAVAADGSQAFAGGGTVASVPFFAPARGMSGPTVINLSVSLHVSKDEANGILDSAASTDDGQEILLNALKIGNRNVRGRR